MKIFIGIDPGYTDEWFVFPFAKTLVDELDRRGVAWTRDHDDPAIDAALLVQWATPIEIVRKLKARGVKIVHRLDGRARALIKNYDKDEENRAINRLADWTVYQSDYVRRHNFETWPTIFGDEPPIADRPGRSSLIYNAVDRSVFRPDGPTEPFDDDAEHRVLHVAFTANVRKGVGRLVEYANLLKDNPKIRFYTIGRQDQDDAHGGELARLPNVTRLGVIVDRARLAQIMRTCDVLLFPSRNDYCPNTVLEAMACGTPVLYENSGGTPELVRDPVAPAGIAIHPHNPVYGLSVLLEENKLFSRRAVERVDTHFDAHRMADKYLALFERLLAETPAPIEIGVRGQAGGAVAESTLTCFNAPSVRDEAARSPREPAPRGSRERERGRTAATERENLT